MSTNFPHHKFCPRSRYAWYVHACVQVVRLARASFEGPVLAMLADGALDMDVEIKIRDGGAVALTTPPAPADGHAAAATSSSSSSATAAVTSSSPRGNRKRSHGEMTSSANVAVPNDDNGTSSSSIPAAALSSSSSSSSAAADGNDDEDADRVLEISERLDTLMTTIYRRIVLVTTYDPGSLTSAMSAVVRARRLYRTHLEGVFERKVRTTDRTKFVQFTFLVLFGRENDALEEVGRLLAKREEEQRLRLLQQQPTDGGGGGVVRAPTTAAMEDEKMDPESTMMPASSDEPLYRGFIAKLIDYFYNPNYAGDAPRRTVVCYLASFVSRATFVCPETVCECLAALLRWGEVYISAQSEEATAGKVGGVANVKGGGSGMRRLPSSASRSSLGGNTLHPCEMHALFYTCCQAAFYIFCFRGAEALRYYRSACRRSDDPEGPYADPESVDIGPERWKFLCGHALQPLKYCLESVRAEFLNLAEDLNLFCDDYVDDGGARQDGATKFLEQLRSNTEQDKQKKTHVSKKLKSTIRKSRRSTIISTAATQEKKRLDGGVGGLGRGSNPLDSFFPFDPYLLQNSSENVHPYFRNWEDCILTIEDDAEDDGHIEEGFLSEDSNSEVSRDDEEGIGDSEEDDSDDEEEDGDEHTHGSGRIDPRKESPTTAERVKLLHDDDGFEMEIRRSRAMSTGSQCSW
jgi:RNA polymerase I-specific transcription initiation factor RRN3